MGKNLVNGKSWTCHRKWSKNEVMKMENILIKSWESHIISLHIYKPTALIWLWEVFGLCSRFKIIMLGRMQIIFLIPYFQFKKGFDFLFLYV